MSDSQRVEPYLKNRGYIRMDSQGATDRCSQRDNAGEKLLFIIIERRLGDDHTTNQLFAKIIRQMLKI